MQLKVLLFLLGAVLHWEAFATSISTPAATFEVSDEWSYIPSQSPERFTLRSSGRNVEVNISVQRASKITAANAELAVKRLLEAAMQVHARAAHDWNLTLKGVESTIEPTEKGWKGEFAGSDSSGRNFRHATIVRPGLILTVYADSRVQPQPALLAVISAVLAGMKDEP